mgnify:CR=1 FL=1
MVTTGELRFRVPTAADVDDLTAWMEPARGAAQVLDRENAYYTILDRHEALVGYCCFGRSAHVNGCDYQAQAIDVAAALRPELAGEPELGEVVRGVTLFARALFSLMPLRTTVPVSQRVVRAWESAGFLPMGRFFIGSGEYLQLALPPSNLG